MAVHSETPDLDKLQRVRSERLEERRALQRQRLPDSPDRELRLLQVTGGCR